MSRFIEVTDIEFKERMFINVNKIIYVCPMGETSAYIKCAESNSAWSIISAAESYNEICEMIRRAGEQE